MRSQFLIASIFALATFASAQEQPPPRPPHPPAPVIVVTGNGEVDVRPDEAVLSLGAVAQAKDAAAAQKKVNEVVQKSIDALVSLGIKKEKIRTDRLTLQPIYEPNNSNNTRNHHKIISYEASNSLQITLDDLTQIGPALDAGVGAGADNIQGVDFQLIDDTTATDKALGNATRQARNKADSIAGALGVKIDGVQRVEEGGIQRVMPMMRMAAMADAAVSFNTPVEPGQIKITATVTVTYRIKPTVP